MEKNGFTVQLALVDALPVLFFAAAAAALAGKLHNSLFMLGAAICILAGLGKVIWKMTLALTGRDIPWLGAQMRFMMPTGFLFAMIGLFTADRDTVFHFLQSAVQMPSLLFFILALLGMTGMIICRRRFERYNVRQNWKAQLINTFAQGCFMMGILLM